MSSGLYYAGTVAASEITRLNKVVDDLHDVMTREVSLLQVEIDRLKAAIREHRDQRFDDRCWLDDFQLYHALNEDIGAASPLGIGVTTLPPKCEFLSSCERYWEQRQHPGERRDVDCMTIAQMADAILALRIENEQLKARCCDPRVLDVTELVKGWLEDGK